ncbi:hypothetical protein MUDAN_IGPPGNFN_03613 [Lactiplantibacillus mudanjiangensis]|nr:hypothetical protein MUDAN_IGPPGNFN_03613 [Lactiplantibacillus mudanjiangensis]
MLNVKSVFDNVFVVFFFFFFQAEDGIRDSSTSRGLGDVYKRQNRSQPVMAPAVKTSLVRVIFPDL